MKFSELELHPQVMAGVEACGFSDCTPIQESAMPNILAARDLAGLAQTGTGKTGAFVIPLIDRIVRSREVATTPNIERPIFKDWLPTNFILVLVPTRELAEQVFENVSKFGKFANITAAAIYGGTGYEAQKNAIKNKVDFIVATPGRLIDLYKEHELDLNQVRAIVFDEADRMFDMGFKDDMKYILRRVPQDRQFLVFSATLNFDVLNTAYEFGANPIEVNVSKDQAKADNVQDEILHVGQDEKPMFLLSVLKKYNPKQAIIFSNFKHNVERIAKFLSNNGTPAMGISSLISQNQRTRIMELFKTENNDRNILVATDVAARGLDIKGVDLVINFELPDDAENYVHRIGRTGRAGEKGQALSLVSDRDVEALSRIENYLGHKVTIGWLDDADLIRDFKPYPRDEGRKEFKREPGFDKRNDFKKGPRRENRQPQQGGHRPPHSRRSEHDGARTQQDHRGGRSQEQGQQRAAHGSQQQGRGNRPSHGGGYKSQQGRHQHSFKNQKGDRKHSGSPRPPAVQSYRHKPADVVAAAPSIGAKISKFFKKLFGEKS